MFKGRSKSLEFIGVIGWKRRSHILFILLEDRISIVKNNERGRNSALFLGIISILEIDIDGTIWNNVIK